MLIHRDWTDASLTSAVDWLLTQCGRTQTECRHACMQLVYNLSPFLPGFLLNSALCVSLYLTDLWALDAVVSCENSSHLFPVWML